MAFVIADRVQETSTSTGTGTIVLSGAVTGYQTFAAIGNTNNTYYTIADQSGSNWEVGIGTYYSGNVSLTRDTVLASSNSSSLVNFGVGTKAVFVTYPAEKAIYSNTSNITTITNFASSNVLITGGTISGANLSLGNVTLGNITANSITLSNGAYSQGIFQGPYSDGIVVDYINTNGRISVGSADSITFYNGGVANVTLATISAGGNLTAANAVYAPYHIATANIAANSATGAYSFGTLGYSDTNIIASYSANANSYAQIIAQNTNNGTATSVDFIVSNNQGTATGLYGDFGMNSGAFAGSGAFSSPNTVYLYSAGSDLAIGTTGANSIHFVVNNAATDAFTINASGAFGANGSYGTANYVLTSQGSSLPPVWAAATGGGGGSTGIGNSSILALNVNITANATINAGVNGFSVGPVNTANGVVVTITSGQRWVIV